MKPSLLFFFSSCLLAGIAGCGSSSEADKDWTASTDSIRVTSRTPAFETRTDTVTAQTPAQRFDDTSGSQPGAGIRYMVQIGAFKEAHHATAVQTLARQRYELPVVNDYNAQRRLYQVRIGFFETEAEAQAFKARLIREHRGDYWDAWAVQISK